MAAERGMGGAGLMHEPLRSRFCLAWFLVCTAVLGPYLFQTCVVERPMFPRLHLAPALTVYLVLVLYWYLGARGFLAPGRNRWRKRIGLVLFAVGGHIMGAFSAVGILAVYVLCEALSRRAAARLPARWWRPRRTYLVALASVLAVFPWLNALTLFGNYRSFDPPRLGESARFGVNAAGLRGPFVERERSGTSLRLLFLGDSTTWGFPYPYEVAYPFQLQRLLAAEGRAPVEVVNGGAPGQNLFHIRGRLEEFLAYRPDVTFLMVGVHYNRFMDPSEVPERYDPADAGPAWVTRLLPPAAPILAMGFLWQLKGLGEEETDETARFATYRGVLEDLIQRVRAAGTRLVVLEYPSPQVAPEIQKLLLQTAEREELPWVRLAHLPRGPEDYAMNDEIHPSPDVHRQIAETIAAFLRADGDDFYRRLRPNGLPTAGPALEAPHRYPERAGKRYGQGTVPAQASPEGPGA